MLPSEVVSIPSIHVIPENVYSYFTFVFVFSSQYLFNINVRKEVLSATHFIKF